MRREKIQEVVATLPEEVDIDVLIEKLYLLHKIDVAERQLARGEGIPHEEVKKQLQQWLE